MDTPDYNKLFEYNEINDILDNNRDTYRKEIGDRVVVEDYSSCTHMDGMELDSEADEEMQFNALTYFIVIETHQKYVHNAYYRQYMQNVIIVNPLTKVRYRICSGHLKLK